MTIIDKVVAAVTPEPTDEEMFEARANARTAAGDVGWLNMILDHHVQVESAFAAVESATSAAARRAAQKALGIMLAGHSIAEETVIYPAMALTTQKGHSGTAYTEQSAAKVQLAALDDLDPMSQDYVDKLAHLKAAVRHHVYEEESKWFPELRKEADPQLQTRLSKRYREEFERYMGEGASKARAA
jgi:hypothetical protein